MSGIAPSILDDFSREFFLANTAKSGVLLGRGDLFFSE